MIDTDYELNVRLKKSELQALTILLNKIKRNSFIDDLFEYHDEIANISNTMGSRITMIKDIDD